MDRISLRSDKLQPMYKIETTVHNTASIEVDRNLIHPSCKIKNKSIGKTEDAIDTKKTLSSTFLK